MQCPKCHHRLLKAQDGQLKLRVPILVFDTGGNRCVTNCPRCKTEIDVPVTLLKSALPTPDPKLVVKSRVAKT